MPPPVILQGRDFYDDGYYESIDSVDGSQDSRLDENALEDRLDFSRLQFQGRQLELQTLEKAYDRAVRSWTTKRCEDRAIGAAVSLGSNANNSTQDDIHNSTTMEEQPTKNELDGDQGPVVVIVTGYSGTGKSALIRQFRRRLDSRPGPSPYFAAGKFDQLQDADPFSAIVEAFSGLVDDILVQLEQSPTQLQSHPVDSGRSVQHITTNCSTDDTNSVAAAVQRIFNAIGKELSVISTLVPNISKLADRCRQIAGNFAPDSSTFSPTAPHKTAISFESINRSNNSTEAVHSTNRLSQHGNRSGSCRNDSPSKQSAPLSDSVPPTQQSQTATRTSVTQPGPQENTAKRLYYVLTAFLQALDRPLVLHLDDIQWMTQPSMDLLLSTVLSRVSPLSNCLFLGSIRSDDPNHERLIGQLLSSLLPPATNRTIAGSNSRRDLTAIPTSRIVRIDLLNLSFQETGDLIADVLCLSNAECESLTKAIYNKTRGNAFYTLQSLEELERAGILFYSRMTFQWDWNTKSVAGLEAKISDNVLDAVTARIRCAPAKLQLILKIAAYTRNMFDVGIIRQLLNIGWDLNNDSAGNLQLVCGANDEAASASPTPVEQQENELIRLLDMAVLERFLTNNVGSTIYRFAHDKVQQAAFTLVAFGQERDEFRFRIGKQLYLIGTKAVGESQSVTATQLQYTAKETQNDDPSNSGEAEYGRVINHINNTEVDKEWCLFIACDHLNACQDQLLVEDPWLLVDVNLRVAEKATAVGAFDTAARYLAVGLHVADSLRLTSWGDEHYDSLLRLHRIASDVELWRGNFEKGYSLSKKVMHNVRSVDDRLPTNLSMALSLGRQNEHRKAQQLYLSCLREMKMYPRRMYPFRLSRLYLAAKRFFHRHSDYDILLLPRIEDPRLEVAMEFYLGGAYQSFYCGDMVEYLMCTLRAVDVVCSHGLSSQSALALSYYALFLSQISDHGNAIRIAELAKKVLGVSNAKHLESLVLFVTTYSINAWKDPHEDVMRMYERAALAGFETGDFEHGALNRIAHINHCYLAGHSLKEVDEAIERAVVELDYFGISSISSMSKEHYRLVRYLRGSTSSGKFATDCSVVDWDGLGDFRPGEDEEEGDTYQLLHGYTARIQLGVYFRRLRFAQKLANLLDAVTTNDAAYATTVIRLFMSGLVYSGLSREASSQRKRWRKKARSYSDKLIKMSRARGLNSHHRHLILEADIKAKPSARSMGLAEAAYDNAVQQAVATEHIQDAALGCELAGEFFLQARDSARTTKFFTQARYLYQAWGADAKVKHLEDTRSEYLDLGYTMAQTSAVTGFRFGRTSCVRNMSPLGANSDMNTSLVGIVDDVDHADDETNSNKQNGMGKSVGPSATNDSADCGKGLGTWKTNERKDNGDLQHRSAEDVFLFDPHAEDKNHNNSKEMDGISVLTDPTELAPQALQTSASRRPS